MCSFSPRISVPFTNNSTFGIAEVNKANKSAVGGLAVGVGPNFIGAVAGSKSKGYNEKRKIDAKLSQAVVPVIENMIVNLGGAEIFSRNDMKKIDAELKFQDSGLIDPNSVVKFGKLSGVKYLITGSIDNVKQHYRGYNDAANSANEFAWGCVFDAWGDGIESTGKRAISEIDLNKNTIFILSIFNQNKPS